MSHNHMPPDVRLPVRGEAQPETPARPRIRARVVACLRASHFDDLLAVGVAGPDGSALAAHAWRVTSQREREAVARTLQTAVRDAQAHTNPLSCRIPLHLTNIAAAEDIIGAVTLRLHSPRPVNARGMARLRRLLADGRGPLYRFGRGDLGGRLGAALAAL